MNARTISSIVFPLALAVAASACSKKEEAAKPAATQPAAAAKPAAKAAHAVGDEVEVEWKGHWYKAKVLAVNGEKFKIHYEGWTDKWDEEVGSDRIRKPKNEKPSWKKGDKVEVMWKNKWYKSEILEVSGDKYKVHYDGWDSKWDEEVDATRIRHLKE